MKTEKKKSKESLIGKIIYGFLLFMPLLSVLVTCLYVIQNENAHESYYGETINETEIKNITNYNELTLSKKYVIFNETFLTYQQTGRLTLYVNNVINYTDNRDISNTDRIALYSNVYNNIEHQYIVFFNGDTQITNYDLINTRVKIDFVLNTFSYENNTNYYLPLIHEYTYNKYTYLDDAFMYGLQKTEDSQYFNWAKNTALYTGVSEFTNTLGITTTYIPFLMTYWLLISVVYLIYDIALMMLHMAHKKIHQLEGSI